MSVFLILLTVTTFVYLPFFANPALLLNRNNDLTEFFWPIFYYLKQNILVNHQIPFWNNMFFAGTPLLPDPQNPIWYLPNAIFLFTDINTGIIISLFLHTLFGSIGMYIASRKVFKFSSLISLMVSGIFTLSPIYFSYLEAGHCGLAISWTWMPYLLLSTYQLGNKPTPKNVFLFAISASSMYFNHVVTALIAIAPAVVYWLYKKSIRYPTVALLLALVTISPALILQLSWLPNTTRQILLAYPETFPIWRGKREYIRTVFLFNPETEKAITFGIVPTILALYGFIKLKRKLKLFLILPAILLLLIVLNNVSPILPLLLKIDFFVLMRVTTRVWFLIFFILLFSFGYALEKLNKYMTVALGFLALVESTLIGYSYFVKPISARENIPVVIYNILESDKTNFRVFCLSRCIPQKEAALRNLHLVEGYGTLPEKNYFYVLGEALNTRWDKYSLSVPPFEAYLYQKLQPNAKLLRAFNTKYVISKYPLNDTNFVFWEKFDEYYLYLNKLWF